MNIDILNLTKRPKNDRAIDIALPVIAIECEATPPLENYLDAYEDAVLKLVDIGLSSRAIALTLNATESLVEEILERLDLKQYAEKKPGQSWELTKAGRNYLDGFLEERESDNSKFGYMFVNAIKKDVLPYFYEGSLSQAPLFIGKQLPMKLTLSGSEEKTFIPYAPKRSYLKAAFEKYYKNSDTAKQYGDGDISLEEAVGLFEELDVFDEVDDFEIEEKSVDTSETDLSENMFIRALNCPEKFAYLTMRIILDPSYPGGYRVESPFDLNGIDNSYYLRQVQWLAASGNTSIGSENLDSFLNQEIRQLSPKFKSADKDFSVFVLEKMPLLKLYRNRFSRIYDDMARIYSLMQSQSSLLEKENIVNNIARNVVESLYNCFFKGIKKETLSNIQAKIKDDLDFHNCENYGCKYYLQQITQMTKLDTSQFKWGYRLIKNSTGRLHTTHGNSILEKLINVIVLNYYCGTSETTNFLAEKDIQKICELTDRLNQIRRKVSHDTDERFEAKDYDFYMSNVFTLINGLLEAYKEA